MDENNDQKKLLIERVADTPRFIKVVVVFLLIVIVAVSVYGVLAFWTAPTNKANTTAASARGSDTEMLFQRIRTWGPCPKERTCHATTTLYTNGEVSGPAPNTPLREDDIKQVKETLKNFSPEDCTVRSATDNWTRYRLKDSSGHVVAVPSEGYVSGFGCEELRWIDARVGDAYTERTP